MNSHRQLNYAIITFLNSSVGGVTLKYKTKNEGVLSFRGLDEGVKWRGFYLFELGIFI